MAKVKSRYRGTKEYAIVYSELIAAARHRGILTYQEIAKLLGWPLKGQWMGGAIGHLLGEISDDEVALGRPMLSAIVVSAAGTPGPGFFKLARNLGRLKSSSREAERAFLDEEQKAVHETWKVMLRKDG